MNRMQMVIERRVCRLRDDLIATGRNNEIAVPRVSRKDLDETVGQLTTDATDQDANRAAGAGAHEGDQRIQERPRPIPHRSILFTSRPMQLEPSISKHNGRAAQILQRQRTSGEGPDNPSSYCGAIDPTYAAAAIMSSRERVAATGRIVTAAESARVPAANARSWRRT